MTDKKNKTVVTKKDQRTNLEKTKNHSIGESAKQQASIDKKGITVRPKIDKE